MKVSRFESAAGWYESVSRDPAPALRPHVHAYWGFEERARTRVRRLEVAFPAVIVIANFAGVIRVGHANGGAGRMTEYRPFVGGLDHGAATTEHDGHIHGIELALSPLGARMVFGVPMHELVQAAAPLDALLGAAAPRLVERLYHAPAWQERFDLLDGFLAERLASAAAAPAEIEWAWRRLVSTRGRVPIGRLNDETGWSRRRLATAFREHVGPTPKAYARMLRFHHAVRRVRSGARDWTRIALDCGYYDQAHFNRDFRTFAGLSPTAFVRRLSPDDPGVRGD